MVIGIDPQGTVILHPNDPSAREVIERDPGTRELRALTQSLTMLRQLANATGTEPVVIVQPSDEASSQRFMDVMNCLAAAEVRNVTLTGVSGSKAR